MLNTYLGHRFIELLIYSDLTYLKNNYMLSRKYFVMGKLPNVGASEVVWKTACGKCKPVYGEYKEVIWSDDMDLKRKLFTHMSK